MPFQTGAQEWRKVTTLRGLGHHHEGQDTQAGPWHTAGFWNVKMKEMAIINKRHKGTELGKGDLCRDKTSICFTLDSILVSMLFFLNIPPSPSPTDAWDKCSGVVHWEDPEGWDGEGGGRGDWDREHMQIHGWFMSMYGKNHYNIIK